MAIQRPMPEIGDDEGAGDGIRTFSVLYFWYAILAGNEEELRLGIFIIFNDDTIILYLHNFTYKVYIKKNVASAHDDKTMLLIEKHTLLG